MKTKAVSGIMLKLLLVSMSTLAFNIQLVKADWTWTETIYIRADGSVDPDTAPISSVDNITYTLTDNIAGDVPRGSSAIVVERNNIIVDGASYTVQGTGMHAWGSGINLTYSNNVTIRNVQVTNFRTGIELHNSGNSLLSGNVASNNKYGITLLYSSNSTLSGNVASNNKYRITLLYSSNSTLSGNVASNNTVGYGIILHQSSNSLLSGNIASNNTYDGIHLYDSSNSTLSGNVASNNTFIGIRLYSSGNNTLFHNNLINSRHQVYIETSESSNFWDDGYPSGGNYWSDHVTVDDYSGINQDELGSDGIVDEPYIIDDFNRDNYPLVEPWSPEPPSPMEALEELIQAVESWNLGTGIETSLTSKLQVAYRSLETENQNAVLGQLGAFVNHVKALRGKKLTDDQADYLTSEALRIIDLING